MSRWMKDGENHTSEGTCLTTVHPALVNVGTTAGFLSLSFTFSVCCCYCSVSSNQLVTINHCRKVVLISGDPLSCLPSAAGQALGKPGAQYFFASQSFFEYFF